MKYLKYFESTENLNIEIDARIAHDMKYSALEFTDNEIKKVRIFFAQYKIVINTSAEITTYPQGTEKYGQTLTIPRIAAFPVNRTFLIYKLDDDYYQLTIVDNSEWSYWKCDELQGVFDAIVPHLKTFKKIDPQIYMSSFEKSEEIKKLRKIINYKVNKLSFEDLKNLNDKI